MTDTTFAGSSGYSCWSPRWNSGSCENPFLLLKLFKNEFDLIITLLYDNLDCFFPQLLPVDAQRQPVGGPVSDITA